MSDSRSSLYEIRLEISIKATAKLKVGQKPQRADYRQVTLAQDFQVWEPVALQAFQNLKFHSCNIMENCVLGMNNRLLLIQ